MKLFYLNTLINKTVSEINRREYLTLKELHKKLGSIIKLSEGFYIQRLEKGEKIEGMNLIPSSKPSLTKNKVLLAELSKKYKIYEDKVISFSKLKELMPKKDFLSLVEYKQTLKVEDIE